MTELKIMPVERCGAVSQCMAQPQSYRSSIRFGEPTPKRVADHALQALESARKKDVEIHERNVPAIENNKAVRARIEEFMSAIGMPNKFSQPNPRSRRYSRTISIEAGYLSDMTREVPIGDGFEQAIATYQRLKTDYDRFAADAASADKRSKEEAQAAEQRKAAERRATIELAKIIVRYGLSEDVDWDGVLEALRGRDKRLDLAIAMEDTRGDWSAGFYRVQYAIDRYKLETDQDKEILADIVPLLADQEDGRVFRDTAWGYEALYGTIEDQQLVKDARLARQRCIP
ncbi:hypothetical protein HAP47_0023150 [Bradyrhizobium sp. 41S5]|uniref:hypothetical protein n=1 Tax=Bradyrhizobium sp. 41S5 TaxID=1404443 RepID=UPI00156A8A02|nr:hypothetical protein [Bradyrhizobium sp. 41S5]UFX42160.1 hypothetical protein HAP47_0023150 [Bradyrhizobium sp. 41S5]